MNKLTRYEQETVVIYNAEEKLAEIYTADPVVIRKLDKMVEKYPDEYKVIKQDSISKTYSCRKKLISFRPPVIMSEERKQELRERLKSMNSVSHNDVE